MSLSHLREACCSLLGRACVCCRWPFFHHAHGAWEREHRCRQRHGGKGCGHCHGHCCARWPVAHRAASDQPAEPARPLAVKRGPRGRRLHLHARAQPYMHSTAQRRAGELKVTGGKDLKSTQPGPYTTRAQHSVSVQMHLRCCGPAGPIRQGLGMPWQRCWSVMAAATMSPRRLSLTRLARRSFFIWPIRRVRTHGPMSVP